MVFVLELRRYFLRFSGERRQARITHVALRARLALVSVCLNNAKTSPLQAIRIGLRHMKHEKATLCTE